MIPGDDGYEVVPYAPRHRSDVLRLRTEFRGIARRWNAAHFRWQQEENPWFEGHRIQLALHRGAVVGMRVLHEAEWEVGEERFRAPCYAGTVVAQGHRSRGLLTRLTRALEDDLARDGVRFAFNLSAGPVTHVSALADGWRSLGAFGAVHRRGPLARSRLRRRAARALELVAAAGLVRGVAGFRLSREPRPGPMSELAALRRSRGLVRRARDERWFAWRFRDPSSRYHFAYLERGGRLAAYLAFHRPAPPLRAGRLQLVDWERRDDVSWAELLDAAVRVADRFGLPLAAWSAAFPEEARALLAALGFEPNPPPGPLSSARPTFLVGRIRGGADAEAHGWCVGGARIDDVRSWDLRPLDADAN